MGRLNVTLFLAALVAFAVLAAHAQHPMPTSPRPVLAENNPWVKSLPPESKIIYVSEWNLFDPEEELDAELLIVVYEQEEPRFDRKLAIFSHDHGAPMSGAPDFQFSSEGSALLFVCCPFNSANPFLVTAWGGGPGVDIKVFSYKEGKVSLVLEKDGRGNPELADLDGDGVDELLIPIFLYSGKGGISWYPAYADIFKWRKDHFEPVARTGWKKRYRAHIPRSSEK